MTTYVYKDIEYMKQRIYVLILMLMIIMGMIECKDNRKGESYHYLTQARVEGVKVKRVPVYTDIMFSDKEVMIIGMGIDRWNRVLNGYMEMEIVGVFDMEIEILKRADEGECYLIMRLGKDSELIENEPGRMTLGFANRIGGSYLYVIPELMVDGDMEGVILHEVGHILGARHTGSGLMVGNYTSGTTQCVDELAVRQVGEYWGYDWTKMNYCVREGN